jgi:hypothetical protein
MLDWCRTHIAAGAWAEHGHGEKRKGDAALYFSRFYFANESDAGSYGGRLTDGSERS